MSHQSDPAFVAPQLSQALIKAPVNTFDAFKTPLQREIDGGRAKITLADPATFDKDLEDLLKHIEDRLALGLYEAWISDYGYGQTADKEKLKKAIEAIKPPAEPRLNPKGCRTALEPIFDTHDYWATAEEKWARAYSELMVFGAYGDAELLCLGTQGKGTMYQTYPSGVVPVLFACQQLSSYALLTRGFSVAAVGVGVGCSATAIDLGVFEAQPPSKKSTAAAGTAPGFATIAELVKMGMGPGSVVAFNHGGPNETGQDKGPITHIGSVLRKYGTKIQFIDTGILLGETEGSGGGEGGTTDHAFCETTLRAATDCVAAGVAKAPPGDLAAAAAKAADCRPLGVARLAIVDLSQPDQPALRYVSKLVHMKYAVPRLLWSLRGLPVKDLRAIWMVYAPEPSNFTHSLEKDAPGKSAPDLYLAATSPILFRTNSIRGEASGDAVIARRKTDRGLDGWVENFQAPTSEQLKKSPAPAPEMGQARSGKAALQLAIDGAPALPIFCEVGSGLWKKAVGQRYVLKDAKTKPLKGSLDDAAPGDTFMTK